MGIVDNEKEYLIKKPKIKEFLDICIKNNAKVLLCSTPYRWEWIKTHSDDEFKEIFSSPTPIKITIEEAKYEKVEFNLKDFGKYRLPILIFDEDGRKIRNIFEKTKRIFERIVANKVDGEVTNIFDDDTINMIRDAFISLSMVLGMAQLKAVGAFLIMMYLVHRENKEFKNNVYSSIGAISTLTPLELERVEKESKISPKTLFNLRYLLKNKQKLEEIIDSVTKHERKIENLEKKVKDIEKIKEDIKELRKEYELIIELFKLEGYEPEEFKKEHLDRELKALGIDAESYKFKRTKTLDDVLEFIKSKDKAIIVLKGSAGVGKSTLMYQIAKELEGRYLTRFLKWTEINSNKIEYFLRINWDKDDVVLFTSYQSYGDYTIRKRGEKDIRILIEKFLKHSNFKFLVIEVRSEYYDNFKEIVKEADEPPKGIKKLVEEGEIEVTGLSGDKNILGIIEAVIKSEIKDEELKISEDDIRDIIKVSTIVDENTKKIVINPLILIVTTKVVIERRRAGNKESIKNCKPIDIVWEHLETTLFNKEDLGKKLICAVDYIALVKEIDRDDLEKICEFDEYDSDELEDKLVEWYIKEDEKLSIMPELFNDVIFINRFLDVENKDTKKLLRRFKRRVKKVKEFNEEYLLGVSTNIANAYRFDEYKDRCKIFAEELLKIIETPEVYSNALFNIVVAGIPVENINYNKLVKGSETTAKRIADYASKIYKVEVEPKPELAIGNIISKLCVNYLENGLEEKIDKTVEEITEKCKDNKTLKNFDEEQFLANTYSMIIRMIADNYNPDDKKEWLDEIFNLAEKEKDNFGKEFIYHFNTAILFHINELAKIHPNWYEYLIRRGVLDNALKTRRWDVIIPFIENAIRNVKDEFYIEYLGVFYYVAIYNKIVEDIELKTLEYQKQHDIISYHQNIFKILLRTKLGLLKDD